MTKVTYGEIVVKDVEPILAICMHPLVLSLRQLKFSLSNLPYIDLKAFSKVAKIDKVE